MENTSVIRIVFLYAHLEKLYGLSKEFSFLLLVFVNVFIGHLLINQAFAVVKFVIWTIVPNSLVIIF
jgi:hypothetical protein